LIISEKGLDTMLPMYKITKGSDYIEIVNIQNNFHFYFEDGKKYDEIT